MSRDYQLLPIQFCPAVNAIVIQAHVRLRTRQLSLLRLEFVHSRSSFLRVFRAVTSVACMPGKSKPVLVFRPFNPIVTMIMRADES